jgi:tRNA(fMet)-specific endonuclease VapC
MVIDTNIFIEYLRKLDKSKTSLAQLPPTTVLHVSSITVFELYVGANTPERVEMAESILQNVIVLPFSNEIAQAAGLLYDHLQRIGQKLEFRDVMIAATAIYHNLPIKTLNFKHFERIPDLKIIY